MSMLMSRLKLTIYLMFSSFILVVTDIHTDGGRTDTAAYRDARTHLKRQTDTHTDSRKSDSDYPRSH